jgi:hypothetical protein
MELIPVDRINQADQKDAEEVSGSRKQGSCADRSGRCRAERPMPTGVVDADRMVDAGPKGRCRPEDRLVDADPKDGRCRLEVWLMLTRRQAGRCRPEGWSMPTRRLVDADQKGRCRPERSMLRRIPTRLEKPESQQSELWKEREFRKTPERFYASYVFTVNKG